MSAGLHVAQALIAGQSPRTVLIVAISWLGAVAGLTLLMRRRPRAFPILAILALPFRVPIPAEGRTVNLLIPLYAVVAAGTLAHLLPRLLAGLVRRLPGLLARTPPRLRARMISLLAHVPPGLIAGPAAGGSAYDSRRPPMALDWLLAASVALYGVQIAYSGDVAKGAQNLVFFYVPFGLLYVLLREAPWSRRLALACFGVAVGLAIVFAGVGFVEYARKELLLNPRVVAANRFDNYFRVNSLFFDPSVYGRFLALVMLGVATAVLWTRRRRGVLIGAGVLAWLWAGMITSFSQTSVVALLIGLAALAALRWSVRVTLCAGGALAAIGLVALLAAPPSLHLGLTGSEGSADNATNGRAKLVSGGLRLFAERPLEGFGSGSFEAEYKRHEHVTVAGAASASHTTPVTVAAEQGIVGLALYVALLAAACFALFSTPGRSPPRSKPGDARLRLASPFRPALAACFVALVAHTLAYADFLEDPFTWTLLGVGVALMPPARRGAGVAGMGDRAAGAAAESPSPAVASQG